MMMLDLIGVLNTFSVMTDLSKSYLVAEHDEIWFDGPSPDEVGQEGVDILANQGVQWDEENQGWHAFT